MEIPENVKKETNQKIKKSNKYKKLSKVSAAYFLFSFIFIMILFFISPEMVNNSLFLKIFGWSILISIVLSVFFLFMENKYSLTLKELLLVHLNNLMKAIEKEDLNKQLIGSSKIIYSRYKFSQISDEGFENIFKIQKFILGLTSTLKIYSKRNLNLKERKDIKKILNQSIGEILTERFSFKIFPEIKQKNHLNKEKLLKILKLPAVKIGLLIVLALITDLLLVWIKLILSKESAVQLFFIILATYFAGYEFIIKNK